MRKVRRRSIRLHKLTKKLLLDLLSHVWRKEYMKKQFIT